MSRNTAKWLSISVYFIAIILMLVFARKEEVVIGVIVVALLALVVLRYFMRCPKCGCTQGRGWLFAAYCPHCGEPLD